MHTMKFSASAALASAMLLCATAAFSQTQAQGNVTQELQAFCRTYDNTWTQKGPGAVAPLFAEDAIIIPPTGAVVHGGAAITKIWGEIWKEPATHKCTVEAAHAEGNGAWAFGEVTITGTPSSHVRWGAFDVKQNGAWKIQLLVVTNIETQAPAAGSTTK